MTFRWSCSRISRKTSGTRSTAFRTRRVTIGSRVHLCPLSSGLAARTTHRWLRNDLTIPATKEVTRTLAARLDALPGHAGLSGRLDHGSQPWRWSPHRGHTAGGRYRTHIGEAVLFTSRRTCRRRRKRRVIHKATGLENLHRSGGIFSGGATTAYFPITLPDSCTRLEQLELQLPVQVFRLQSLALVEGSCAGSILRSLSCLGPGSIPYYWGTYDQV